MALLDVTLVYSPKQLVLGERQVHSIPKVGDVVIVDGKNFNKEYVTLKVEAVVHDLLDSQKIFLMLNNGYILTDFLGSEAGGRSSTDRDE